MRTMPNFLASSGPVDIVASGTVIGFEKNPIEIVFDTFVAPLDLTSAKQVPPVLPGLQVPQIPPSGGRFKLIFRFVDEEVSPNQAVPPHRIQTRREEGELTLGITFFNFKDPIGTGSIKPIQFGFSRGRNLYLHYRISALAVGDKTMHFTIFQSRTQDAKERPATEPPKEPQKETNA